MKSSKKLVDNFEFYISFVLLWVALVILFIQVVLRYVFHYSTAWAEELARYAQLWLIFISASFATKTHAHVRIDALVSVWPKKWRPYIYDIGDFIWMICNLIVVYFGFHYTVKVYQMGSIATGLKISLAWIYAAIPVGYLLMTLRLIQIKVCTIRDRIRGGKANEETNTGGDEV